MRRAPRIAGQNSQSWILRSLGGGTLRPPQRCWNSYCRWSARGKSEPLASRRMFRTP
jgi:hypothetical protein